VPGFSGIFAPIPTPFAGEAIAYPALAENLEKWAASPLDGLVVLGSNGEAVLLDEDEKVELVRFVAAHNPGGKVIVAGTGCESTRATVRLTRRCAEAGAQAALVLTPGYYKGALDDATLERFFTDVADAAPVPVLLYNMPRNTGVNISAALAARLSRHPNIAGIKDSGGNIVQIQETIAAAAPGFAVFAGSGGFLLATLLAGGVGGTMAVANLLPDECAAIYRLFCAGRLDEARDLQRRILPLNWAVTGKYGVAGLKAALEMRGYSGGDVRRPLLPVGEAARAELRRLLADGGW
jgi:4-hydroxy-2-oxoglutarate aldolase